LVAGLDLMNGLLAIHPQGAAQAKAFRRPILLPEEL